MVSAEVSQTPLQRAQHSLGNEHLLARNTIVKGNTTTDLQYCNENHINHQKQIFDQWLHWSNSV
mgnify:CR=1 FL=1